MIDFQDLIGRALEEQNDEDSHVETSADVFHPSQLANCKRQCVISKYGLNDHDVGTLGTFHTGTMIHEWIEESLDGRIPAVEFEKDVSKKYDDPEVAIKGRCDAFDHVDNACYDFKSRASWWKFDPPSERHINQLTLYMDMLGADRGQVVYVCKKNLEVKTWPEDGMFEFDPDRRDKLLQKAETVRDACMGDKPESIDEVPFDKCSCWICNKD